MRVVEGVALIENRILCNAIWGDTSCLNPKPDFTGYIYGNACKVGRAFIEYCIAKVYGIFRLPQCGYDNYLYRYHYYDVLDPMEVDDACEEMREIINHVQKQLMCDSRVIDKKISVVRCLSDFQIQKVAKQLMDESNKEIELPVSIFSSYSYDGNINQVYPTGCDTVGRHINIKEEISIEDIVLWDCYVGKGTPSCSYVKSMFDDERELWVVDRSINGLRRLKRDCFYYLDGIPEFLSDYRNHVDYGIDKEVYAGAYKRRPCEYKDLFTRFMMKKNLRRIRKENEEI